MKMSQEAQLNGGVMLKLGFEITDKKVTAKRGIQRIADLCKQQDKRWLVTWVNFFVVLNANDLRQIADKLDELNGVEK